MCLGGGEAGWGLREGQCCERLGLPWGGTLCSSEQTAGQVLKLQLDSTIVKLLLYGMLHGTFGGPALIL